MVLGLPLKLFELSEKFLFSSSASSELIPEPIDSQLSVDDGELIESVNRRRTLLHDSAWRLRIHNLVGFMLLWHCLVTGIIPSLPLLCRLEILLFGLSGNWSIGDCLLRLVPILIGLRLLFTFSLAGGNLLLQPSAIVSELRF